jgi:hypothetical protein
MLKIYINQKLIPDTASIANLSISRAISSRSDNASMTLANIPPQWFPLEEKKCEIFYSGNLLFQGVIRETDIFHEAPNKMIYKILADSSRVLLARKIVSGSFSGTIKPIIQNILQNKTPDFSIVCPDDLQVSKINIETDILDLIQIFSNANSAFYYLSPSNTIYIVQTPHPAPLSFSTNDPFWTNFRFSPSSANLISVIKIRDCQILSNSVVYDQIITADGLTDVFSINYKFSQIQIELLVNDTWVPQKVGAEFIHNFPGFQVLYDFQSYHIRFENHLPQGTKIRISGFPYYSLSRDFSDIQTIERLKTLTGGDGIYEYIPKKEALKGLNSYQDVFNFAKNLLNKNSKIPISGVLKCVCSSPLPELLGKKINVTYPLLNLSKHSFLISNVKMTIQNRMFFYEISVDSNSCGIDVFLADLVKEKNTLFSDSIIPTTMSPQNSVSIASSFDTFQISKNQKLKFSSTPFPASFA